MSTAIATREQDAETLGREISTISLATNDGFTSTFKERFWAKVDHLTDNDKNCWLWTGGCSANGYGCVCTKAIAGRPSQLYAHRVAYEVTFGPIPGGLHVLHQCDVRRCVRPDHLFLGTAADNMADASKKGRIRNQSRITPEQVREIRRKYASGAWTFAELGRMFGVCFQHAHAIVRGNRWENIQ